MRFIEDGDESVDLVLFVNGFPVATAELKNPLTNQTVAGRDHAVPEAATLGTRSSGSRRERWSTSQSIPTWST